MRRAGSTLLLRIPSALHQRLKQQARSADLSLNKHCLALLSGKAMHNSQAASSGSLTLASGAGCRAALLQDLSARVLETWVDDIEGLVLFGSFARRRETSRSDIDLLIVLRGSVDFDRDIYERWQIREFGGREVAPLFVHIPGEGERIGGLWFEVAIEGIVLFDRELQLSRFLSQVRNVIADGRVKRMVTHGHPYWVYSSVATHEESRSRKRLPAQGQREAQGS
jgi:predicted nucleotidyltransferase